MKEILKSSKLIAAVVAVLALVWIGSGLLAGKEPQASAPAVHDAAEKKIPRVRVREIEASFYADDVILTGRSRASRRVDLRAEIPGQVQDVLKEEGDRVEEGDILAMLEVRELEANVTEAEKRLNQRQVEYDAAKQLETKGYSSKVRLAEALAELEDARAALKKAEVDLTKTEIKAPFGGTIFNQDVERGDYLSIGDPLFAIVDLDPVEFVGFISERRIQDLSLGIEAVAEFLNGELVPGRLTYIAPAADPDTRTFRIVMSAPNENLEIKEGLTAKLRIPVARKKAHKISPSILSLNDEGRVGVKIVNAQDIVEFVPVEILADTPDAMWIMGLPEKTRAITVGQEFVIDGQKVEPVESDEDGLL